MKANFLAITPQKIAYGISPQRGVLMLLDYDSSEAPWLAPDMTLGLEMTPAEARTIAHTLLRKAAEAEDKTLQ